MWHWLQSRSPMELARQLTLLSCQNSKEHVYHIVPGTSNMQFLETLKMKWLVWDTVDVLVDTIGVKLPFVPSPFQYSACSPLLSCSFNLWCKRSSFFHFNVFPPGQRCFQWAVSDSGVSAKARSTLSISLCTPLKICKCYLQKSMIPRNCSSMCIACAGSIRRRLISTCMVGWNAREKGIGYWSNCQNHEKRTTRDPKKWITEFLDFMCQQHHSGTVVLENGCLGYGSTLFKEGGAKFCTFLFWDTL